MNKVYFISGIDTDCGKTVVTGLLARGLKRSGVNVITQKLVQTGCLDLSDDILKHRELMQMDLQDVDREGTTCPYLFELPASPHLAARLEGREINPDKLREATDLLQDRYELVLLEGAGGLFVPLKKGLLTIDYLQEQGYPLILVTSSRLGSINHTLMSLEACCNRKIKVAALVYNRYPNYNDLVTADSKQIFEEYLKEYLPETILIDCPAVDDSKPIEFELSGLFD